MQSTLISNLLSLYFISIIRFFSRSVSRHPLCDNGLREQLSKSVILRRVPQNYRNPADRTSGFYQHASYEDGGGGQLSVGQGVGGMEK